MPPAPAGPDSAVEKPLPLFWRLLEAHFQRAYQIRPLDENPRTLLAYNLFRHQGGEVRLQCGAVVEAGDVVMELHFRRAALAPLIRDGDAAQMGLGLIRLAKRDMPRLAAALERDPALGEVKAIHALTLFHRGVSYFGFEVKPVRERHLEWWFTLWHRLLLARDHAWGASRLKLGGEALVTRHIWLSREALIRRCGEKGWKADPAAAADGRGCRRSHRSHRPDRPAAEEG